MQLPKLYIISHGDVRRGRATLEEIREFVNGSRYDYEDLARVEIDDDGDGDIIATPLTAEELQAIGAQFEAAQIEALRALLDDTYRAAKATEQINGVSWSSPLIVWLEQCPFAENVITAWAEDKGAEIRRDSPPRDTKVKTWHPSMTVSVGGRSRFSRTDVVRVYWPEREVNTDAAIDKEIADVKSERTVAEDELASIAGAL